MISPNEFNPISYIGFNQKQFAKSIHISTRFHPLNSTWFQRWFQHDFTCWIQQKWFAKSTHISTRCQSCVPAGSVWFRCKIPKRLFNQNPFWTLNITLCYWCWKRSRSHMSCCVGNFGYTCLHVHLLNISIVVIV